jgi:RNA polymerase sigma-70 factor (ECF subfamily)
MLYRALEDLWPAPSVTVARLVAESYDPAVDLAGVEAALRLLAESGPTYAGRDAELALADLEWRTGRRVSARGRYEVLVDELEVEPLRRFCLRRATEA